MKSAPPLPKLQVRRLANRDWLGKLFYINNREGNAMSEEIKKRDAKSDAAEMTFKVGKGNQSAICGGVTPARRDDAK